MSGLPMRHADRHPDHRDGGRRPVARTLELSSIFYSDPILTVWSLRERLLTTGLAQTKLTVEGYYYQWANHPVAQCEIVFVAANTAVDAIRCDVTDLRVQFVDADYARGVGTSTNRSTSVPLPIRPRSSRAATTSPMAKQRLATCSMS
jgi:hypothetical protein